MSDDEHNRNEDIQDDELQDDELEDNELQDEEEITESESEEESGVRIEAEYLSSEGGNNLIGRGNITNVTIVGASDKQIRNILEEVNEASRARHIPPPPPADAPFQERANHWFKHELTTDRLKFFAITLSMFNGLKYPDFKDVYEVVLQVMDVEESDANDEEKTSSYFRTPDDELVTNVKARVTPSEDGLEEIITFEDERYVDAIFNLTRRQYRGVLFDLLPALKQVVERYRYWEVRSRAALTVAEVGRIGFHRVRSRVLEPWARNSRAYVRAAVGYPLARLAEDETSRIAVRDLLDDWTDKGWRGVGETWRYRWTAASTFKQIGTIEANGADWAIDWACQGLKKVAGFDDIRLADSVIHSLIVLSLQGHLERVLFTIKEWIEEGSAGSRDEPAPQTRCIVGILAFMVLSEIHIELATEEEEEAEEAGVEVGNLFELVRQSEAQQGEYWQLIVAVSIRAFENRLADAFFNLIRRWTEYAADNPNLQNTVRNLLAEVFVHLRPLRREHVLNRLTRWEKYSKDEYVVAMAVSAKEKIRARPSNRGPIVFGD